MDGTALWPDRLIDETAWLPPVIWEAERPATIVVVAIVTIPTVIIHNACPRAASRPFYSGIVVLCLAFARQRICIAAFWQITNE
jgi:hypothetical protein